MRNHGDAAFLVRLDRRGLLKSGLRSALGLLTWAGRGFGIRLAGALAFSLRFGGGRKEIWPVLLAKRVEG